MIMEPNFEKLAKSGSEISFVGELWALLRYNKKYWLMPIIVTLWLFGVLAILSTTAIAPFIYSLF